MKNKKTPPKRLSAETVAPEEVAHLSIADAVRILKENGCETLTVTGLKRQIASGAPANPDGTVNLVHYAAWLCHCSKRE